ncbi:MAG TPA: hypothetical protein VK168_16495 [Saprospiraceae bacterium]|nr:hypothetical protein [Saprospiraceae bacterium]
MNRTIILFVVAIATTIHPAIGWGQTPTPEYYLEMNKTFQLMYYSYQGEKDNQPLTEEQLAAYQEQANAVFSKEKNKINASYPVFVKLFDHMRTALDGNAKLACRHLRDALVEFDKIDQLPLMKAKAKRLSYTNYFNIDRNFILSFYQSETSRSLGLVQGAPCDPGAEVIDEPISHDPPEQPKQPEMPLKEPIIKVNNPPVNKTLAESPIEKLERLLSRGLVDSLFEIHQMIPGDGRIIPGQNGVPYDVKFKNAKTKEILYFLGGRYVIEDDGDTKRSSESKWMAFEPAIRSFSELVVAIMQDYGNGAYHVFVQGSADNVTFRPKNLHPDFDGPEFKTIPMLSVDKQTKKVSKKTVLVGDTFVNPVLPQLRAAFVRCCLLINQRLKEHPDKVTIVEGSVKPIADPEKRNCSIILYIDWEKAKAASTR